MKMYCYQELLNNPSECMKKISEIYRKYEVICSNESSYTNDDMVAYLYYGALFMLSFLYYIETKLDIELLWEKTNRLYKTKELTALAEFNLYLFDQFGRVQK